MRGVRTRTFNFEFKFYFMFFFGSHPAPLPFPIILLLIFDSALQFQAILSTGILPNRAIPYDAVTISHSIQWRFFRAFKQQAKLRT